MDSNQVNEPVKGSSQSPVVNVRIPEEYQSLIRDAARLETAGNISGFIRQAAIKAAREIVKSQDTTATIAS